MFHLCTFGLTPGLSHFLPSFPCYDAPPSEFEIGQSSCLLGTSELLATSFGHMVAPWFPLALTTFTLGRSCNTSANSSGSVLVFGFPFDVECRPFPWPSQNPIIGFGFFGFFVMCSACCCPACVKSVDCVVRGVRSTFLINWAFGQALGSMLILILIPSRLRRWACC